MQLHPVILAGGSGTRLWPVSRELYPKQFHRLASPHTLLQDTALRARDAGCAAPLLICNEAQRFIAAEQLREIDIEPAAIVLEPEGRGTAAAVATAAVLLAERGGEGALLVLPSDHAIAGGAQYRDALRVGAGCAGQGRLVTFGVPPDRPATGYGYIRRGAALAEQAGAFAIDRFEEKPDAATAQGYLDAGDCYWNSGMFLLPIADTLAEMERLVPEVVAACRAAVAEAKRDLTFLRLDPGAFAAGPDLSFDVGVMERTAAGAVVPFEAAWSDLGAWDALWELGDKDADGNVIEGDVIALDCRDSYIRGDGLLTALLGVDNLVVVVTDDAVLIADRGRAEQVRRIVERLKQGERSERSAHTTVYRPWGAYSTVAAGSRYQVKRIVVQPGAQLSLQMHHHRAEHWVVVSGTARVLRGEEELLLHENQSVYIPLGTRHRLENPGMIPLELIEVQSGDYLGEDDIVRFADDYGRDADG